MSGLPAQGGTRRARRCNVTDRWDVRAVLLDMDGTLIDTERTYFDSLVGALNAFGYTDDIEALCHAMVGLPGPDCEAMLQARYGDGLPDRNMTGDLTTTFTCNIPRSAVSGAASMDAASVGCPSQRSSHPRSRSRNERGAGIRCARSTRFLSTTREYRSAVLRS